MGCQQQFNEELQFRLSLQALHYTAFHFVAFRGFPLNPASHQHQIIIKLCPHDWFAILLKPQTPNSKPQTPNCKPQTVNPKL